MSFVLVKKAILKALENIDPNFEDFSVEYPSDIFFGDYSSNVAMVLAKKVGKNPKTLAGEIVENIKENKSEIFEKIEVAGPGFINFYLSNKYLDEALKEVLEKGEDFGKNEKFQGKKVIVEYTDPNAFKPFHIGHLMANAIGESISRLVEFSEAKIVRICYPSDIGLHIAKAIWAIIKNENNFPKESDSIIVKTNFLGTSYVEGTSAYEQGGEVKIEIENINHKIFDKSDNKINEIYDKGKAWSLEHFEHIYKKVGTKFDAYIYESEVAVAGAKIVGEFLDKGVFEKSEGATIFKGENFGLHTRVFINSKGLPTYEAKELGLNFKKFELFPDTVQSIIVTANEQDDYFNVLRKVLELINPDIGKKTRHIGHGMLRFAEGKMSSRKGNVITGESLIEQIEEMVAEKIKDSDFSSEEKEKIKTAVAVGAIKYSILKQSIGGNIIFDFNKSVSFEGDSGPYLQYSYARANSVLEKGKEFMEDLSDLEVEPPNELQKFFVRFPEIVKRAEEEMEPHHVVTYLVQLAGLFNNFYAHNQVVDLENKEKTKERLSIVKAFSIVMKNGLKLLAIPVLERM